MPRRNARGGRSAAANLIAALRCLYKSAEEDGLIDERDNPTRKVAKPRRLPSTRRAVPDTRLAEINQVTAADTIGTYSAKAGAGEPVPCGSRARARAGQQDRPGRSARHQAGQLRPKAGRCYELTW